VRIASTIPIVALLLLLPSATLAQYYRYDGFVLSNKGPLGGQSIAVCSQPAITLTQPCSPLVSLYQSSSGVALPNPTTSDSYGNFHFYVAPGTYTIQVYGPQVYTPYVLTDQLIAGLQSGPAVISGACILDGVVNTTLSAAIACATTRGGKVWVPPSASNYTITSTVTVPSGIDLECLGSTGQTNFAFGPCSFSVSAGVPALLVSGSDTKIEGLHLISADVGANTDDCMKITGFHARILNNTCEHFGRDGFRIDSSGPSNANFPHLEQNQALSNFGDGIHLAPGGANNNAGTYINNYEVNNGGYGFHVEAGNDLVVMGGDVQGNTTGGYYLTNSVGDYFLNPYCEGGVGSSFTTTTAAGENRIFFPLFGQCTTITDPGVAYGNEIHYYGASNFPQQSFLSVGPQPGASSPTIYQLLSGFANNGWASFYDQTHATTVWEYNPTGSLFYFLTPLLGTFNAAQYYIPGTANNNGSHNDSGFMQTQSASGCTTPAVVGNSCATAITMTWNVAFADTGYKVMCTPTGAPTNVPGTPYVLAGQTASAITINYQAMTAAAASWPTINCMAVHN
jgi:hypothetical protein